MDKESKPIGEEVDDLMDHMVPGAVVLNAPEEMNIEETRKVRLTLSLSECVLLLMQRLSTPGEQTMGGTARVSNRMTAVLSGDMFEITAVGDKEQAVSQQNQTQWVWNIRPKKKGQHTLSVVLSALVKIEGKSTPRKIKTFDRNVEVRVTRGQVLLAFLSDNWKWLLVTLLFPVALRCRRWIRRRVGGGPPS
jgi:hypothetical protein